MTDIPLYDLIIMRQEKMETLIPIDVEKKLRGIESYSLDLLYNNVRSEMFRFQARQSENFEAYTTYLLKNFREAVAEI